MSHYLPCIGSQQQHIHQQETINTTVSIDITRRFMKTVEHLKGHLREMLPPIFWVRLDFKDLM